MTYDIRTGRRDEGEEQPLRVMLNWPAALKK